MGSQMQKIEDGHAIHWPIRKGTKKDKHIRRDLWHRYSVTVNHADGNRSTFVVMTLM